MEFWTANKDRPLKEINLSESMTFPDKPLINKDIQVQYKSNTINHTPSNYNISGFVSPMKLGTTPCKSKKNFSKMMHSLHKADTTENFEDMAGQKLQEYANHAKITYLKMLTSAIGRDLNHTEIEKVTSKADSTEPSELLDDMLTFVVRILKNCSENESKEISNNMIEDYDKIYSKMRHNFVKKTFDNDKLFKSIGNFNDIIEKLNYQNTTQITIAKHEQKTLQQVIKSLVDDLENRKKMIIQLKSDNDKKDFEINYFKENQLTSKLVETKLVQMGNFWFEQISFLMKQYTEVIGFLEQNICGLTNSWHEIKEEPGLVYKKNKLYSTFFVSMKDIIEKYEQNIKKVDFNHIKNIVRDYKASKANQEHEINKKRYTHFSVINYKRDDDIRNNHLHCNLLKEKYEEFGSRNDFNRRKNEIIRLSKVVKEQDERGSSKVKFDEEIPGRKGSTPQIFLMNKKTRAKLSNSMVDNNKNLVKNMKERIYSGSQPKKIYGTISSKPNDLSHEKNADKIFYVSPKKIISTKKIETQKK